MKINIQGINKLSKERLLYEFKKIAKTDHLEKLLKDKSSLELISLIFPEFQNLSLFSRLNSFKREILKENDFIFILSLIIINGTDNMDYFLYKFNMSKKDHKRMKIIDNFYKKKINSKTFTKNNLNSVFYYNGKGSVNDILNYQVIRSKNFDKKILDLIKFYQNKTVPQLPINADLLMTKYNIPQGKMLGDKLKKIEEEWVNNNFEISNAKLENIVQS